MDQNLPKYNLGDRQVPIRLQLTDKPGALAKVASVLGEAGISIDRMRQYGHSETAGIAPVLIVTHKTTPDAIDHAIEALPRTGVIAGEPVELRLTNCRRGGAAL